MNIIIYYEFYWSIPYMINTDSSRMQEFVHQKNIVCRYLLCNKYTQMFMFIDYFSVRYKSVFELGKSDKILIYKLLMHRVLRWGCWNANWVWKVGYSRYTGSTKNHSIFQFLKISLGFSRNWLTNVYSTHVYINF